jgi:quinol monooxygenase YgiN
MEDNLVLNKTSDMKWSIQDGMFMLLKKLYAKLDIAVMHTMKNMVMFQNETNDIFATKCDMSYVLIIHEVLDYDVWKKVFDNAAKLRKDAGEISYQLLRYDQDKNQIVHFSKWKGHQEAKAFFESPRLIEIRKEAGVQSPQFIYLEEIESGTL